MGKGCHIDNNIPCKPTARDIMCVEKSVNYIVKHLLFVLAFVFVYAGAWGQTVVASYDFEVGDAGWQFIDSDGDGENWNVHINTGSGNLGTHAGSGVLNSQSYDNDLGVLTPDNWAITTLNLPASNIIDLRFWVAAQDDSDYQEHYGVYISTTNPTPGEFLLMYEETLSTNAWVEKQLDLSAYAGQNVYLAFRHFSCSNMFYLLIDDITVTAYPIQLAISPTTYNCGTPVTITASIDGGSVPSGYIFHWYSDAGFNTEITSGVSGTYHEQLAVASAEAGVTYYCRLESISAAPRYDMQNFYCTGGMQSYTIPDGAISLKLEVWGAQGGDGSGSSASGGKGGYSTGTLASPTAGNTLYVCVGGKGSKASKNNIVTGGYNGGGASGKSNSNSYLGGSGGGATHISTANRGDGKLGNYNSYQSEVLIVAGGGGGAGESNSGGVGGGDTGGNGTSGGSGGTQNAGGNGQGSGSNGAFGQGGAAYATQGNYGCGGGGGGWYGGGGGGKSGGYGYPGGGGSGYIKSSLTDKDKNSGERSGDGMAKITAMFPYLPNNNLSASATLDCIELCTDNPGTFAFSPTANTMNIGGVATYAASNSTGLTVTYWSANEAIATVDSDGRVSAISDGVVEIFARIPKDEVNNYCADTISYTLTVNCAGSASTVAYTGAEYNLGTGYYTYTYAQGTGLKYPAISVNGASLPSTITAVIENTGGADVVSLVGGNVKVNTLHGGSAHVTIYVPAADGYCHADVEFDVLVTCTPVSLSVSSTYASYYTYDAGTNTYTFTFPQDAGGDAELTDILLLDGSAQLPPVTICNTDNPYVSRLINGTGSNRLFWVNVSSATDYPVPAWVCVPSSGTDCASDTIRFVINVTCTDPVVNYSLSDANGDGDVDVEDGSLQISPEIIFQYYYASGATPFPLQIEYPGQSGYTLPYGTRFRSSNTTLVYMEDNKIMVNRGGVGTANVRLIIPATGSSCKTIVDLEIDVKYPCLESQDDAQVGTITGNTDKAPVYDDKWSYSQQLYRANELGISGVNLITRVSFKVEGMPDVVTGKISMYMGETDATSLSDGWITDITKVVANKSIAFHNGWVDIELERPFLWHGTKNLVVGVYNNTEKINYDGYFKCGTTSNCCRYYGGTYYRDYYDYYYYEEEYGESTFSIINKTPYNSNDYSVKSKQGNLSNNRPVISICATKQYTLTYYEGSTCNGGTVGNIPEPQIGKGLVTIPTVTPICSAGHTFVGWATSPTGTDYYLPGGSVDLVSADVDLYAVFKDNCSGITVTLKDGSSTPLVVSNDTSYYKACVDKTLRLVADVSGTIASDVILSSMWSINNHNGEEPVALNGLDVSYIPEEICGSDIDFVTVIRRSGGDCVVSKLGRIKIGGGLTPSPNNYPVGEICLGNERNIHIGSSAAGSEIAVNPIPVDVTANLGQTDTTFIPDGPYCLDECYTSSVTFYDFEPGSTVTSADNIEFVRINLEHSFIADLQIKLTCPDGKSVILLQDMADIASGGHDADSYGWPYEDTDWPEGGGVWNYAPIGFGVPSRMDGVNICSAADQTQGIGADYCWSESLTSSHYASSTNSYVYEMANHIGGGENAYMLVIPSDMSDTTQVYKPREHFSQLIGCPLNGTWTLSICDYWDSDNGYIFNWEVSLKTTSLMAPWGYTVDVGESRIENSWDEVEAYAGSTLSIRPTNPDQNGTYHTSYLVMSDNLGCDLEPIPISYNVSEVFHVDIIQDNEVCVGTTALLSTYPQSPTFTYHWRSTLDGSDLIGSAPSYTTGAILSNSSYVLVVEDSDPAVAGCESFAYADVGIKYPAIEGPQEDDVVWTGKEANWNADYNWFQMNENYGYDLLSTGRPTGTSNVYIANYECTPANPTLTINGEAFAKDMTITNVTLNGGSNTLNVAGDLTFSGTADFAPGTGTVKFVGSGDQTITKSNEIEFNNVVFNQGTAGHTITADNGITVSGAATFTNGVVVGDATFEENSRVTNTIAEMTRASYVDGLVTKKGSETFTFPTGGDGVLGAFSVTLGSNTGDVNVKFNHSTADNGDGTHGFTLTEFPRWWNINDMCSGNNPQLDHVSNFEYWKVEGLDDGTSLSNLTLKVDADAVTDHFHNPSAYDRSKIYAAAHYDCWKNLGTANVTVSDDHKTITVAGVSSIPRTRAGNFDGIVTLGSTDHSTVLPIELTALTATCDGRSSLVEWTTASERNNDYFSLERSDDAINFTEIARIAGAGNSIVPLDYSYTDYGVHGGDNYYRLVQVDYDGSRTVSEMVVATCVEAGEAPEVLAYPNPFNGELTVELENFSNRPARIDVYDVLGRLVYTEDADAPQNSYQTVLHLDGLPEATYTVRVATSDFVINRKVVKQ